MMILTIIGLIFLTLVCLVIAGMIFFIAFNVLSLIHQNEFKKLKENMKETFKK